MGLVNTGFTERVRYTLFCIGYDSLVAAEPDGWQTDDKEYARNEDYDGIFTKFSNDLKFYGEAAEMLKLIYLIDGVNAEVTLTREEMNPNTDLWELSYTGFLDMMTYDFQDGKVSLKFNSGGIEQVLKARENEPLELDRETDMDGNVIDPLEVKTVALDGRRIFLQSKWEVYPENNRARVSVFGAGPSTRSTGIPLSLISKSHEEAQDVTPGVSYSGNEGEVGAFFFLESIEPRQLRVYGKLKFIVAAVNVDNDSALLFTVAFRPFTPSPYYQLSETNLLAVPFTYSLVGQTIEINFDEIIQIQRGWSLSMEFFLGGFVALGDLPTVRLDDIKCDLNVDEDSFYEPTSSKFILAHDVLERQVEIMTGKKSNFHSEYFGRPEKGYAVVGKGGHVGATHGFWVRNFDKLPISNRTNINPFKPFTSSFQDSLASLEVTHNVGLGIEKFGFSERIRVEEKSYFYNRAITVRLGDVSKIKRSPAPKYFYKAVDIGYEKGGTYEEAMGLDEYNAKSRFTTCILRGIDLILNSKWRADAYGKEFARRKQRFRFGTTDTSYDNDIFVMDLKPHPSGQYYLERKWQDDFAEEPSGVYDPGSATNLRFSPFNLIFTRHAWVISAGLTKYLNKFLSYASSTANSRLETKLRTDSNYVNLDPTATPGNGSAYREDGKIVNSDLKRARYAAEYVEFDRQITYQIMQQIEGFTIVGGKRIENKYGLFEFRNEDGDLEYGYMINVKPNGNGRVQLLVFNR